MPGTAAATAPLPTLALCSLRLTPSWPRTETARQPCAAIPCPCIRHERGIGSARGPRLEGPRPDQLAHAGPHVAVPPLCLRFRGIARRGILARRVRPRLLHAHAAVGGMCVLGSRPGAPGLPSMRLSTLCTALHHSSDMKEGSWRAQSWAKQVRTPSTPGTPLLRKALSVDCPIHYCYFTFYLAAPAPAAPAGRRACAKRSVPERLSARVAGLVNLLLANALPRKPPAGLRGSSSVSTARPATTSPGGPSQNSSVRQDDSASAPYST